MIRISDINAERDASGRAYVLLGILQQHAPNRSAQAKVTTEYNLLFSSGMSSVAVEKALVAWLYNGFNFGTWPWNWPTEGSRQGDDKEVLKP